MSDAIQVGLAPDTVHIARDGDPVEVVISIQNAGTTVDQYAVELDGLPTTWYGLSNSSVALFPQDRDEAKLILHPPKGGATKAGTYPFTVTVLSRADPTQTSRVQGTLQVAAVAAFELDVSPRRVIGRQGRYRVSMRNGGNADLDVSLEASDAEDACRYAFQSPTSRLTPGQQAVVGLVVRPRRTPFAGPRKTYDFQIKAAPAQGEPKTLQAQLVYTPRLGSWKPVRRLILLALVLAALAVFVSSQGGIDGVQRKAPQWRKQFNQLACQRLNLLCDAIPPPTKSALAAGTPGTGILPLLHATPTPPPPTREAATSTPPPPSSTTRPPTPRPHPPTATPLPPTATPRPPTPKPRPPTPRPHPPTATPKPPPPTATPKPPPPSPTPLPPTATPHPPTATPKPTPQAPEPVRFAAPLAGARFFSHTHHNLSGPFLDFWNAYGGLDAFGFPRTEPFRENGIVEQYTDRFRLQLVNGQLSTAPLGRLLTAGRTFPPATPFADGPDRMYFPHTRHGLTGRFLTYWQHHHGDILLGAPIAEPTHEQNSDGSGRIYLVQWCENGRLEYHPEFAGTRYEVELGLLGKQDLQRRGWLPPTRPAASHA